MADFAVSLIDIATSKPDISEDCSAKTLTVEDNSDYDGNTESGHGRVAFTDFRKIIFENGQGTLFTFSSFAGADGTIGVPSAGPGNDTVVFNINNGDDVYKVTLIAIPTYLAGATYEATADVVFNPSDKKLYQSLTNANTGNTPDSSPSNWKVIEEADLSVKYRTFEQVAVICDLNDCIPDKTFDAWCVEEANECNPDVLCINKTMLDSMRLVLIRFSIQNRVGASDFDSARDMINRSKVICNC